MESVTCATPLCLKNYVHTLIKKCFIAKKYGVPGNREIQGVRRYIMSICSMLKKPKKYNPISTCVTHL